MPEFIQNVRKISCGTTKKRKTKSPGGQKSFTAYIWVSHLLSSCRTLAKNMIDKNNSNMSKIESVDWTIKASPINMAIIRNLS